MSATNVNRDTTAVDYLNWTRLWAQSQQAAKAAGSNFVPNYILQLDDIIDITDSVSLGPVEPAADTIDITDSVTLTVTGQYVIDTAQIDFSSVG